MTEDKKDIKLIVSGSRDFKNYEFIASEINKLKERFNIIEIVEGGARGVDLCAAQYAYNNDIKQISFPAMWNQHGRGAGIIRNESMAEYGNYLIAFPYENSRGTNNMIKLAKEHNLDVVIVKLEGINND